MKNNISLIILSIIFIIFILLLLLYIIYINSNNSNNINNNIEKFQSNDFFSEPEIQSGIEGSIIIPSFFKINQGETNEITYKCLQINTNSRLIIKGNNNLYDILIVGGGGGGGARHGGGGGGGSVIYLENQNLQQGTYDIIIGNGGKGAIYSSTRGENGGDTIIKYNNINKFIARGGGGSGHAVDLLRGGSGGGGWWYNNYGLTRNDNMPFGIYGNDGGTGTGTHGNAEYFWAGGGGGGAARDPNIGKGKNAYLVNSRSVGGNGGSGLGINILGITKSNEIKYYGAGGGGGCASSSISAGIGGYGGGGNGSKGPVRAQNGVENTGSGGGGGGFEGGNNGGGGDGGSGVVIIRYKINNNNIVNNNINQNTNIITYPLNQYPSNFISTDVSGNIGNLTQSFKDKNGSCIVKFSSYSGNNTNNSPIYLFDLSTDPEITNRPRFKINAYNYGSVGNYTTQISKYNNFGINEYGEWISITFPYSFYLKQYGFIAMKNKEYSAPGRWKLYGKNNNDSTFKEIDNMSNGITITKTDYNGINNQNNNTIMRIIDTNNMRCDTYLFIFKGLCNDTSISNNTNFDGSLNFNQILLYGIDDLNNTNI